jgi:histidinol-phosphate aminotransferase
MSVSRRGFLQGLGMGRSTHAAAAFMAARGHEEMVAEAMQQQGRQGGRMRPNLPPGVEAIRISSNENPLGPGKAAIDAILGKFPEANRYPFNSSPLDADLEILIARLNQAKRENVVLGVGSQELLKNAARVFLSPTKHLVIPSPTYGDPAGFAQNVLKYTVKSAPVTDKTLKTDLGALMPLVKGAGLVYLCNPNNPTGTINSAQEIKDFIAEVKKASPTTAILLDEAYSDYVSDPGFATAFPVALATPGVLVARTFSKAYGMAGVRIGYAIGDAPTIKKMAAYRMPYNVNTFGVAAAIASLKDPQHIKEERPTSSSPTSARR